MSVNEPKITESGNFITLAATPEDKALLAAIARQDGSASQSAIVRKLIRDEARKRGLTVPAEVVAAEYQAGDGQ